MSEFKRAELARGRETLGFVARLLAWQERNYFVRAASCRICGDSKTLEKLRGTLEKLLSMRPAGKCGPLPISASWKRPATCSLPVR